MVQWCWMFPLGDRRRWICQLRDLLHYRRWIWQLWGLLRCRRWFGSWVVCFIGVCKDNGSVWIGGVWRWVKELSCGSAWVIAGCMGNGWCKNGVDSLKRSDCWIGWYCCTWKFRLLKNELVPGTICIIFLTLPVFVTWPFWVWQNLRTTLIIKFLSW